MDFRPLEKKPLRDLARALRSNGEDGVALLMDRETSFAGTSRLDMAEEVASAVASVPVHY